MNFNKKGFTIVELVIVIAVIAILAGVLIPTFTSIVDKANESSALQEAKNTYNLYLQTVDPASGDAILLNVFIKLDAKYGPNTFMKVEDGALLSKIWTDSERANDLYADNIIDLEGNLIHPGVQPGEPCEPD